MLLYKFPSSHSFKLFLKMFHLKIKDNINVNDYFCYQTRFKPCAYQFLDDAYQELFHKKKFTNLAMLFSDYPTYRLEVSCVELSLISLILMYL